MSSKYILLVEDNPDDEALTLRTLRKCGLANEVHVVRDGAEALDFLFKTGRYENRIPNDLPALVLLDLKLPKIDGLDVLKRIRAYTGTKLLPVVIFTSSKEQQDLLTGYTNGANGYVRKPVDFAEFAEAVSALHLYWMITNEPAPR